MEIKSLFLADFRNYRAERAEFSPGVNLICGENAQGKTNLLEGIYLLSCGKSFRSLARTELIRFGESCARAEGEVLSAGREFSLSVSLPGRGPAAVFVNGVRKKTRAELAGILNVVLFRPDDLELIRAGADRRRKMLDSILCQLRPAYAAALLSYNRFFENKQRILKDGGEKPSLLSAADDFSRGMAEHGALLIHRRAKLTALLEREASQLHREISGGREEISLRYQTVSEIDPAMPVRELADALYLRMMERKSREIEARSCLVGPHRDDVEVQIDGRSARAFGSQGQARTAALALKLAERQIFLADTGETPVLLLDDVLSELDPARRDFVLNRIKGGQVIIASCERERLRPLTFGKTMWIEKGCIFNKEPEKQAPSGSAAGMGAEKKDEEP